MRNKTTQKLHFVIFNVEHLSNTTMSVRDPLMEGEGEFHSYVEDTETETGYSVAHLDLFLSRVCSNLLTLPRLMYLFVLGVQLLCGEGICLYFIEKFA
jgi:hypothetical protein